MLFCTCPVSLLGAEYHLLVCDLAQNCSALGRLGMLYSNELTAPVFRKQHYFCKSPAKRITPVSAVWGFALTQYFTTVTF